MNTVAIIQARMSSTRLPGKSLLLIDGKPILWYVITRSQISKDVDKIIIATSTDSSDDVLVNYCQKMKLAVFRGSLDDVLTRYYEAAKEYQADTIVRITGDCPLIDGMLISQGLQQFHKEYSDYLSNIVNRTYPRGFDFEIFTFQTLEAAFKNAQKTSEREHVTPYIYQSHPERFKISHFVQQIDKSAYQITVDTPEDYQLLKILIEKHQANLLSCQQIIALLETHPELRHINQHIHRKHFGQ